MVDRPVTREESLERIASVMVTVALLFGAHIVVVVIDHQTTAQLSTCPLSCTTFSLYQLESRHKSS
jgi:hypothetical protein